MNKKRHKSMKGFWATGFTLVELIIVVAIIGILAAIAIPSYTYYVRNSKKIEAKANLSSLAVLLEEYNSLYGMFCPDCTDLSNHSYIYKEKDDGTIAPPTNNTITNWLDIQPKQAATAGVVSYDYTINATSNTAYTITAAPVVSRGVLNNTLTITQTGSKNGW